MNNPLLAAVLTAALALGATSPSHATPLNPSPTTSDSSSSREVASVADKKKRPRAQRWVGYKVNVTRTASGRWIGGYRVGGAKGYRIDPHANARLSTRTRYKKPTTVKVATKGKAKKSRSVRAAYILSRYGNQRSRIQAAAVDAAVLHLLRGGKWTIKRRHGKARIRQARNSSYVRSYARQMLRDSAKNAGRIQLALTATPAEVGAASKLTATVRNTRTGKPVPGAAVTLTPAGQPSIHLYTNSSGQVQTTVTASQGATPVAVVAKGLPAWKLAIRAPRQRKASRMALAGVRATVRGTATIAVAAQQQVTVTHPTLVGPRGTALGGSWTVAGGLGARQVTFTAHGPFTSAATCSTAPLFTSSATVTTPTASGALPTYTFPASGYYRWNVTAGENVYSKAASTCGAALRVQAVTHTEIVATHAQPQVPVGTKFGIDATVVGFDRVEPGHTLTARLYGPFAKKTAAKCTSAKQLPGRSSSRSVSRNGTYTMTRVAVSGDDAVGWYAWQSSLTGGELVAGSSSACRALVRVVR